MDFITVVLHIYCNMVTPYWRQGYPQGLSQLISLLLHQADPALAVLGNWRVSSHLKDLPHLHTSASALEINDKSEFKKITVQNFTVNLLTVTFWHQMEAHTQSWNFNAFSLSTALDLSCHSHLLFCNCFLRVFFFFVPNKMKPNQSQILEMDSNCSATIAGLMHLC